MVNMKKPKVSIVTGYYNREDFVKESIESLLNQTYENIEIIIFDDASKDNTLNKIYETVDGDDRAKIIAYKNNIGFVNGLIQAIESSTGDYIAIHGSGDISLPDRIEKQVNFLNNNSDLVGVSCFYTNIDPVNKLTKSVKPNKIHDLNTLVLSNPFSHGEIMFRKYIYNLVDGYRKVFIYSQDWDLWIRMAKFGNFGTIQEVLYNRIVNFKGVSYNPRKLVLQKKYSLLAIRINNFDSNYQTNIIENIDKIGIDCFIDKNDSELQKMIFFMFNVLLLKNQLNSYQSFFDNSISYYKIYYKLIYFLGFVPGFYKSINFIYVTYLRILQNEN